MDTVIIGLCLFVLGWWGSWRYTQFVIRRAVRLICQHDWVEITARGYTYPTNKQCRKCGLQVMINQEKKKDE